MQTSCQLVLFPDSSPTLPYMMKTGEEPSRWSRSNWGGAQPVVSFKLGRSPAGGLVQICTYDPRNVLNSLVDNLNIEASTGLHHSHKLVSNDTSILD